MIRAAFIFSLALLLAGATLWLVAALRPLRIQWTRPTVVYTLYVNASHLTLTSFTTEAESPVYGRWSIHFSLPLSLLAITAALIAVLIVRRRRKNAPGFPLQPPNPP
jgi:hypothetical protein